MEKNERLKLVEEFKSLKQKLEDLGRDKKNDAKMVVEWRARMNCENKKLAMDLVTA